MQESLHRQLLHCTLLKRLVAASKDFAHSIDLKLDEQLNTALKLHQQRQQMIAMQVVQQQQRNSTPAPQQQQAPTQQTSGNAVPDLRNQSNNTARVQPHPIQQPQMLKNNTYIGNLTLQQQQVLQYNQELNANFEVPPAVLYGLSQNPQQLTQKKSSNNFGKGRNQNAATNVQSNPQIPNQFLEMHLQVMILINNDQNIFYYAYQYNKYYAWIQGFGNAPTKIHHPTSFMIFFNEHRKAFHQRYKSMKMNEVSKIIGQGWRLLGLEKQNQYKLLSMYMRDHPIPGVEWNSPDGIRQYKRAMGLELGDIEAMIQHIMTTIAPTGVYNGTPNPGECEQTPPEGQMLEENGEMLLRSSQDGQMGHGGNFTPDAQGGEQIIPSAVFGQSMTDDILFKYQLSDDAIAQYQ